MLGKCIFFCVYLSTFFGYDPKQIRWKTQISTFIGLHLALCASHKTSGVSVHTLLSWVRQIGQSRGIKFRTGPSINWPRVETSQQNWVVLFWGFLKKKMFLRMEKSNCWLVLCTFSTHQCGASRHCGISFTIWKGERIRMQEAYKPPM